MEADKNYEYCKSMKEQTMKYNKIQCKMGLKQLKLHYNEAKLVTSLGGLLVHEQMHSLQRTFKAKFDKLMKDKGMPAMAKMIDSDALKAAQEYAKSN